MRDDQKVQRLLTLAREVAEEFGGFDTRGAQRKVAAKLGVDESLVSKWRREQRSAHSGTFAQIEEKMGLDPSYWTDDWPNGPLSYREYLKGGAHAANRAVRNATAGVSRSVDGVMSSVINGVPIESIRHQAVRNLFKDPTLKVQHDEVEILEDIVENISALSGLSGVETLLRAAFIDYRKHPERYGEMVGVKHVFEHGPQSEAGKAMTDAAKASGEAKGHAPLGKPKKL